MFTDSFLSLHSSCLPAIPLSSFSPISSPSYFQSSLFSAPFPLLLALEINVLCMQTISISLNHFFSFGSIRCMCAAVVARLYSLLFHSILRALGTFCTTVVVPCFTQRGIDAFVCVCVRAREWFAFSFIFCSIQLYYYYHCRLMQLLLYILLLLLSLLSLVLLFLNFAHKTLKWFYMRFYLIQCSSSSVFCEIALS